MKKYAIRFIHNGASRTYIVADISSVDAILQAIDLLECDVPDITACTGLCLIAKAYPEGAHLADEGEGPLIDTTRRPLQLMPERAPHLEAA